MSGARYVHGHHESVLRFHRTRTVHDSAAYLLPELHTDATVLDVGCGPGSITADLAELVASVTTVETSPDALDAAARLCAERELRNVRFLHADVAALPFPDGAFDVVHAHQVLQHVADPVAALREMRRVCAPGGVVAARDADYAAMTWYPELPGMAEWRAAYRRVARAEGGEPDAGRRLLAWALAAGFTDVMPTTSTWTYATPESRAWWGGLWAERVTQSKFADATARHGVATSADLERMSAAWRAWADEPGGWFAVLHGEVRCRA
ncbi:class I SAM-dependent methyltransferase [Haloechinothrix halophila]|uniref:class I SAM-dependent methyltransferase n=1 Tax=Haloechinothrix halophila TaxID=1069073 RepID=UPI0005577A2B|nr:class I SAM-dependent methyltransferase [Haloechinothrix halophila]